MLRVGNCSGFYGDRLAAMREMLTGGELDVLTGDYLAELTMFLLGRDRAADPSTGYAKTFLAQLRDCLGLALERGVRIVANAGGVNPPALVAAIHELGTPAKVAHVRGDELTPGRHAYLGAFGIARALEAGADVVVTGRVTDASLVVGPAIAHHGWTHADLDALAGATVAGHVIECGTQATGGNYPFLDEIPDPLHPGFPIAEIAADGSSVITKHPGTGGAVTVGTVTAQLVYEVGGAQYLGPDVTTRLDTISLRQAGPDRVEITGVRGELPVPALKVLTTRPGGYRNEVTVVLTGLDAEAKADLFRRQFEAGLRRRPAELVWQQAGPLLTVVGKDTDERVVGRAFSSAAVELALASYAGLFSTAPPGRARPYGLLLMDTEEQDEIQHEVVLPDGTIAVIDPPPETDYLDWVTGPPAPEAGDPGPVRRLPLGTLAGARSGDKGADANVGFWVRDDDAYAWLAALITEPTVRTLLPEAAELTIRITRLPAIRAVNVVIEGLLGNGMPDHTRFDPQAKSLGEVFRAQHVDIPTSLLTEENR